MKEKKYIIPDEKIRPMLTGRGTCIIPDTVLVYGKKITYCYRIMPEKHTDSGWRFFSGSESEEYLSRRELNGTYDLNIAANYCPELLPILRSAPPYSAFELDRSRNHWEDVTLSTDWSALV